MALVEVGSRWRFADVSRTFRGPSAGGERSSREPVRARPASKKGIGVQPDRQFDETPICPALPIFTRAGKSAGLCRRTRQTGSTGHIAPLSRHVAADCGPDLRFRERPGLGSLSPTAHWCEGPGGHFSWKYRQPSLLGVSESLAAGKHADSVQKVLHALAGPRVRGAFYLLGRTSCPGSVMNVSAAYVVGVTRSSLEVVGRRRNELAETSPTA
jgi:hypothetical protein